MRLFLILALLSLACTPNQRARQYGGSATTNLPPDQKLVNVTWKGNNDLWILTRPMRDGEVAETYTFKEDSSFGILSGEVIIKETVSK